MVPVPNNSVCVFYRPFQAPHLQQHLPYVITPAHTIRFFGLPDSGPSALFPCGSPCPISVREERGSRTSVELKTSDGSLSNGQTPKLELRTFTIEMLNDGVHVSTGIGLENGGVVRSQLRDGAVMTLTCKLALERVRTLLSNEVISGESRSYQLRHDLLSREFILSSPGHPIVRQKQFDTLLASAFQHLDFLLPLQAPLVSGETYRVQLKITLEHAEVPPWLEKALFFWSWEVTPPLSFSQDFIF